MTTVSQELQDRVEQVLTDCINLVEAHYQRQFKRPAVAYDITGTTAGTAWLAKWQIRLHPGLLMEHTEEFIMETVPHEFAHLVTGLLYPHKHELLPNGKWAKQEIHGRRWREVMAVLGAEPTRTHNYDMEEWGKPKTKYEYFCPNCNNMSVFGPKRHSVQQGSSRNKYYCGKCYVNGDQRTVHFFQLRRSLGRLQYRAAFQAAKGEREVGPEAKFELKLKAPTGNSKMARCWNYYLNYRDEYDRQAMISLFVYECDCTEKGAATYYANCKKLYDNGIR